MNKYLINDNRKKWITYAIVFLLFTINVFVFYYIKEQNSLRLSVNAIFIMLLISNFKIVKFYYLISIIFNVIFSFLIYKLLTSNHSFLRIALVLVLGLLLCLPLLFYGKQF